MKRAEDQCEKWREEFPMLQAKVHGHPLVYLDSAATAQKPRAVIEAISRFYSSQYGTVHRAIYSTAAWASAEYQQVRRKVQAFINARSADEIVFTKGTTDGINLVAHSFSQAFIFPGDEIIISEMEHHSNIVPWQLAAEARGATLRVIPVTNEGELDLQALKEIISDKTKIVAVSHTSNALGTINPVKEIIEIAHAAGAKVLLDGAQAVPHQPIDVQAYDVDFFVFSGHKMCGPTGIGCLFGKKELLEKMPPYQGGGDMIDTVTFEKTTFNSVPVKFEAGTPMIAEVIGLGAAIDYLNGIGMEIIQQRENELLAEALPLLSAIPGLTILGQAKNRAAIITFTVEGVHPLDIATLLDTHGIAIRSGHLCVQPLLRRFGLFAAARASFAFYNTKAEIHHFCTLLGHVISDLR